VIQENVYITYVRAAAFWHGRQPSPCRILVLAGEVLRSTVLRNYFLPLCCRMSTGLSWVLVSVPYVQRNDAFKNGIRRPLHLDFGEGREVRGLRPGLQILDRRPLPPFRHCLRVNPKLPAQRREPSL
jgi:hypothetical protein